MLLNIIESNLQTNDNPLEPFTDVGNGIIEYRFKYAIELSDIKLDLSSIVNESDFGDFTVGIYYRLGESDENLKNHIRLEDVSSSIYDTVNGITDITGLITENNGYVELQTKYKIGCKVFGIIVQEVPLLSLMWHYAVLPPS